MEDEKKETIYIPLYFDYYEDLADLEDAELGRVIRAILAERATGETIELTRIEKVAYNVITRGAKRAEEKYMARMQQISEARRDAVNKRWEKERAKKAEAQAATNEPHVIQTDTKNTNVSFVIQGDTNDTKEKEKEKENEKEKVKKYSRFAPPTAEEVRQYCNEHGYMVDADQFVDFYTQKGWMVGKSPMKDWQAAVRTWVRRRQEDGGYKQTSFVPQPDDYPF